MTIYSIKANNNAYHHMDSQGNPLEQMEHSIYISKYNFDVESIKQQYSTLDDGGYSLEWSSSL